MAGHLKSAGYGVQSYDKRGGGTHASPRHAAEGADMLFTMLPDGEVVREVVLDALPGLSHGALVVDMSSSDPLGTQALGAALAANRIGMVDAPVSGAVRGAIPAQCRSPARTYSSLPLPLATWAPATLSAQHAHFYSSDFGPIRASDPSAWLVRPMEF